MRKSADTLGNARTALGRRERASCCHSSLLFRPTCLPAFPPTPIDWQTWPAIRGLPPGPAPSPAPSGGQLLRPAGSPLALAGGYSAKVEGGGGSRTPPCPPRASPPRQTRSLGSETETPGPSRWSYHGGPRRRVGRQTQSLPTPRGRRGPVRQTRFLEPSPRSTRASGKPRPGRQGSVAPSERASERVRARRCRRLRGYLVDPASSICLSQRLSHAGLSTRGRYSETANGSLNQLWFL